MILKIRNLGIVASASIDLRKPLILMCGPNSTGKTYVSYLLYTLYSQAIRNLQYVNKFKLPNNILSQIKEKSAFTIDADFVSYTLKSITTYIKKHLLSTIFAISKDTEKELFKGLSLNIEFSDDLLNHIQSTPQDFIWNYIGRYMIQFTKEKNSFNTNILLSNSGSDNNPDYSLRLDNLINLNGMIYSFIINLILEDTSSRMLTVERNSIYTFSKELSLNRSGFGEGNPLSSLGTPEMRQLQRYPLAITDSLKIADDLLLIQKRQSPYYQYAIQLEQELLKGKIEVNNNGAIEFVPQTMPQTKKHLPIQMSSSIVKTMSSLIVYLKHLAKENDLLIIDEPEMNLHPDNQIILTRIFGELINKGLKLVISTHSDYIIREFNNLIMSGEIIDGNSDAMQLIGPYHRNEILKRDIVEPLYFNFSTGTKKVKVVPIKVSKFGFDVRSIDETILHQNRDSQRIYDILKYGSSDE